MNRRIGKWNVPLPALMLLSELAKKLFGRIADVWLKELEDPNDSKTTSSSIKLKISKPALIPQTLAHSDQPAAKVPQNRKKQRRPPIGIGIAMVFGILCCITAARIEKKRLNVIRKHNLLDKPDEDIPMSIYWLLFQFFLLAGLDKFCEKSVAAFYVYQAPGSMKNYLACFCEGVFGLGFMCSVLSVYVVGKISEKRGGGKSTNWFQFTLNRSRLDKYYFVLAGLSSVNLLVFVVVALFYRYKEIEEKDQDEVQAGIGGAPGELPDQDKNVCSCCG